MVNVAIILFDITKRSGTERAVCNLANLLANSGKYKPIIISICSEFGSPKYEINQVVTIRHLGINLTVALIKRLCKYLLLIISLRKFFNSYSKKDISFVLGTAHGINMFLPFLGKNTQKIGCEHIAYSVIPIYSQIIRRIIYSLLNAVVVLTLSDAKRYYFHSNVRIIPNSLSFIPSGKADLYNKRVLAAGRLTYQKGFDLLIEAIALIKEKCDGWEFRIVGSGEDEEKLQRQIDTLELSDIVKIYPATSEIVAEYLQASIFVLSSRFEGFGLVLIEAQSLGIPVISFNCPSGPDEIIHDQEDGLLVENGNIRLLGNALLDLMLNQEKRIRLGMNALKNITKYKPENVFAMWDDLLSV